MKYNARAVYQQESVASIYDGKRFTSIKGQLTHRLEINLIFRALTRAGVQPQARILDAPCGTGRLSMPLAARGYQVTGVDLSEAMLSQARAKNLNPEKLVFQQGDAENLPFPDQAFDVLISLRFLGHVPPEVRQRVLAEFKRVSGGRMILAYYLRNCLQGILRQARRRGAGQMWFPVTRRELEAELAAQGLRPLGYWSLAPLLSETLVVLVGSTSPL